MCDTADSLMLTQCVWYSKQINADTICVVQKRVKCPHKLCGTADNIMFTQYGWYSREFNAETICVVQQTG
jgi:hypothetical protein